MLKYIHLIFLLIIFSGCASLANNIAPAYADAYKAIRNAVVGFDDSGITKEMIDKIPYASSLLKIGKGPEGLLILESISSSRETWISADGVYLVVENGRIIKTAGLNNNLIDYISPIKDFRNINELLGQTYKYYYSYDYPELRDLKVEAQLKLNGKQEIKIFDEVYDLILIEEEIANHYLGWSFINKYWADEEYNVIKSIQKFSPILPEFTMVVTKKPSS